MIRLFSFLLRIIFRVTLLKRFIGRRYVALRHKSFVSCSTRFGDKDKRSVVVLRWSGAGFPNGGLPEGEVSVAERWDPGLVLNESPETQGLPGGSVIPCAHLTL